MPLHTSWKGYLRVSLVSVPLKAYTAASPGNEGSISFNQLHEPCKSRIRYLKVCPIHGEVENNEIVKGYQYAKDQYVVIDLDEIEKLRPQGDKSINVDAFVPADKVDPLYMSGQTYYLVPDGPVGQKPYALLHQAIASANLHAVGRVVITNKERVVRIRALDRILVMDVLQYDTEVKKPETFDDELVQIKATPQEHKLTKTLLDAMTDPDFDIANYPDEYTGKLTELIEAKVEGRKLVSPPAYDEPPIFNLMDALKESLDRAKKPKAGKKPPRRTAASARQRAGKQATAKKKRSG